MTSTTLRWLLTLLLFLIAGMAHAQTACPPGMTPYGVGVCGYDNSQQQPAQQAQPQLPPPPPQWATRWGAIATDAKHGALGAVTDLPSQIEAADAAIAACQSKGGSDCKIQITYDNECAAMVVGDRVFDVTADTTVDKAVQAGMNSCSAANDHTCHVYYSACSLPVRIQ
jgi:hypothetical protein